MRSLSPSILVLAGHVLLSSVAIAEEQVVVGGDVFAKGSSAVVSENSPRDAIASGFSVELSGRTADDAVATGFDVDVEAPVGADLYAAGFSIEVEHPVGGDVTGAGFNIHLGKAAGVGGNARLAAGSIVVDGPVSGALVAAGGSIEINGTISGDARLTAGNLEFGPEARIGGALTYLAAEPVEIPASVISPDRVRFEKIEGRGAMEMAHQAIERSMPGFWPSFVNLFPGFVVALAFLVLLAAAALRLAPATTERLRENTIASPLRNIGVGLLTLGATIGLVPVSAMTLIGIPFIPLVFAAIAAVWVAGYLLGVYAVAWQVAARIGLASPTLGKRVAVVAAGSLACAALNVIPLVGWLVNFALVLLGLGGIANAALKRLSGGRSMPLPPSTRADAVTANN